MQLARQIATRQKEGVCKELKVTIAGKLTGLRDVGIATDATLDSGIRTYWQLALFPHLNVIRLFNHLGSLAKVRSMNVGDPYETTIKANHDAAARAAGGALCDAKRLQIAKTRWRTFH
jgi:hypothetical protein